MTDQELIRLVVDLEPESEKQEVAFNCFIKSLTGYPLSVVKYFTSVDFDEIDGKVSAVVYERYCEWCSDQSCKPESRNAVGLYVKSKYNMTSVQTMLNGKRETVYRWCGYQEKEAF